MAKIVLDPEESAIEAFAKLFFSATRNMGLSDKEACEALKNSIEAAENAPAEERYAWYDSPEHVKLRVEAVVNDKGNCNLKSKNNYMVRTIYERNEDPNQKLHRMAQFFVDITGDEEAIEFQHLTEVYDIGVTPLALTEELKRSGVFNEDGLPGQRFVDCGYFRVVEMKYVSSDAETNIIYKVIVYPLGIAFISGFTDALKDRKKQSND